MFSNLELWQLSMQQVVGNNPKLWKAEYIIEKCIHSCWFKNINWLLKEIRDIFQKPVSHVFIIQCQWAYYITQVPWLDNHLLHKWFNFLKPGAFVGFKNHFSILKNYFSSLFYFCFIIYTCDIGNNSFLHEIIYVHIKM